MRRIENDDGQMLNIHLYPSPFLNESRILREVGSLARLGLFERIELVGVWREGLAPSQPVSDAIGIERIRRAVPVPGVAGKVLGALGWSLAVYRRYRRAPLACINCHSVATLPLGVLLKRATGARLVYDTHELETETNGLRGLRKFFTKLVERSLIRKVDHAIFVGRAIEDWYVREYGLPRTAVLYNCPVHQDVERTDYFRETYAIPPDRPIFLYQGVIAEGRGVPALVAAFAGIAERAALVVMGYGPLAGWVESQARRHANIFYHAAVPPDRLLAYTAAADYGLSVIEATSLSYEYCMPNKLFEYLMAGKPVLVSPTREQRDFVAHTGVGEVAADTSPEAIRQAALRMLDRDREALASAVVRARQTYSWERQEAVLERVYMQDLGFAPRLPGAA